MLKNNEHQNTKHFEYLFNTLNPVSLEQELLTIIEERPILKNQFDTISVIHHNSLNTLVPQEFFNPNLLKDYLKFNIQLLDNDFADFDSIDELHSNNVYLPFVNINNVFLDYSPSINYYHSATIFLNKISSILKQSSELFLYQVFINVYPKDFQLAIFINEKLYLYNHFEYHNSDEFLYYLFFALESIKIDENKTKYYIFGIDNQDEIVKNLRDFTNNLSVFSTSFDSKLNNFIL